MTRSGWWPGGTRCQGCIHHSPLTIHLFEPPHTASATGFELPLRGRAERDPFAEVGRLATTHASMGNTGKTGKTGKTQMHDEPAGCHSLACYSSYSSYSTLPAVRACKSLYIKRNSLFYPYCNNWFYGKSRGLISQTSDALAPWFFTVVWRRHPLPCNRCKAATSRSRLENRPCSAA